MHSFISFFKSTPAFSIALGLIFVFEIGLHFVPNLHYFDGKGAFFTYYKRYIVERGKEDYDIVLLGDSRSLSIKGNPQTPELKYSLYNFSLPAAGPWYFKYFLKKYLAHHEKPKLVIWAVDPQQFYASKTQAFHANPALWNEFKHRLLNLFSPWESIEQYEGRELFFILKEYIPHSLLSVRHRQGFESILTSRASALFQTPYLVKENIVVENVVKDTYGQVNLGNFFFVPNLREIAEKERDNQLRDFLWQENFNLDPLRKFLDYAKAEDLTVVVLNIPRLREFQKSHYFQKINPAIENMTKEYPNSSYLEFSNMEYDLDLFSEAIHYNSNGEKILNDSFRSEIIPKLYEIIEVKNVKK